MSKYVRTKDRILDIGRVTHRLTADICDYHTLRKLRKGALVTLSKKWFNYYGYWVDVIDEKGCHYSIRPDEVGKVTEELTKAGTIEELCDCYLEDCGKGIPATITKSMWVDVHKEKALRGETMLYACIIKRDDKGTHIEPVAKMNEKGNFKLL